ncbi:hypothetical protein AALP_AAs70921U000100 [Arabis alpina]|uniref:Uncharacterized protein n=1 Tax=Arabis alpina TaxID=50452 RepID=A0A087G0K9_ARAAL|nr:hypothetical protein AALP_AAs70921U000100 [Arabis alpina]
MRQKVNTKASSHILDCCEPRELIIILVVYTVGHSRPRTFQDHHQLLLQRSSWNHCDLLCHRPRALQQRHITEICSYG